MKNLLINDLKRSIDLKRTLLAALVALIALFFFVQFFSQDMTEERLLEKLHIGIVDLEESELSRMLIQSFASNDKFSSLVSISEGTTLDIQDEYNTGVLTAIVTIPENFTTSLLHYENEPLHVVINPEHPLRATVLSEMLNSYSDYIGAVDASTYGLYRTLKENGYPESSLKQANDLYSIEMISTALGRNRLFQYNTVDTFPATTSGVYFASAILVMVAAFSASGILPLVFDDLRLNCVQRYLTVKHKLRPWVVSKLIALSLNATLLCVAIAFPIGFLFNLGFKEFLILTAQIGCISLFYGAMSLFIGLLIGNETSATVTSNLLIFALGLFGGNFIPLPLMPKSIQNISAFTPNYWAIRTLLHTISGIQPEFGRIEITFLVLSIILATLCAKWLERTLHKGGIIYE